MKIARNNKYKITVDQVELDALAEAVCEYMMEINKDREENGPVEGDRRQFILERLNNVLSRYKTYPQDEVRELR